MQLRENVLLGPLTTLGVGGPARYFVEARSEQDVCEAVAWARARNLPLFVLGGGSNLVVSDAGWPGLVVKIALRGVTDYERQGHRVFDLQAGEDWDEFVAQTVSADCAGLECLSGIPGTVGGTPVQNVGAYGQDVSETIERVRALKLEDLSIIEFNNSECGFSYRTSRFNSVDRDRHIILRVSFVLTPGGTPNIQYADLRKHFAGRDGRPTLPETREAVLSIRRSKAMLIEDGEEDSRSAGSFFKNPIVPIAQYERIAAAVEHRRITPPQYPAGDGHVKVPAAWLIEQSGVHKGFQHGPVAISRKHTLALVNRGGATASDVLAMKNLVQSRVREAFGVELVPEPVFVGF